MSVLIIDSDTDGATRIADALSTQGLQCRVTGDGMKGVQQAREAPPQLIILCVELSRMSGYSICNKLKRDADLAHIPVILTSQQATEETFEQHRRLKTRADAYLQKPFASQQLMALVGNFVALRSAAAVPTHAAVLREGDASASADEGEGADVDVDAIAYSIADGDGIGDGVGDGNGHGSGSGSRDKDGNENEDGTGHVMRKGDAVRKADTRAADTSDGARDDSMPKGRAAAQPVAGEFDAFLDDDLFGDTSPALDVAPLASPGRTVDDELDLGFFEESPTSPAMQVKPPSEVDAAVPALSPASSPAPARASSTPRVGTAAKPSLSKSRSLKAAEADGPAEQLRGEVKALRQKIQTLEATLERKELEFHDRLMQESKRAHEAVGLRKQLAQMERELKRLHGDIERLKAEHEAALRQHQDQLHTTTEAHKALLAAMRLIDEG